MKNVEIIACVSTYEDYNNGDGGWIELNLPMDEEELEEKLAPVANKETFLSDAWVEDGGFKYVMNETDNVHRLNEVANRLNELDDQELKRFAVYQREYPTNDDLDGLEWILDDGHFKEIVYAGRSFEDLGKQFVESKLGKIDDLPFSIVKNMDFEAIGVDEFRYSVFEDNGELWWSAF